MYILGLRWDLHDALVEIAPLLALWIHEIPLYNHYLDFVRGDFRPKGQTPQLAECWWDVAPMISTWRKKYKSRFR